MSEEETPRPLLRVVRGAPDDVELAALTSVIAAAAASGDAADATSNRRSLWGDPAARLRRSIQPGPGAWRASALPQ